MTDLTIQLPKYYRKNGYTYELLQSSFPYAIYSQSKEDVIYGYEVVKVRIIGERAVLGRVLKAQLRLPSNEDFGTYGWAYVTLEAAEDKYEQLKGQTLPNGKQTNEADHSQTAEASSTTPTEHAQAT